MLCRRCGTENWLTSVTANGPLRATQFYDGDALRERVKKVQGGQTTVYVGSHYEYNVNTSVATSYYYAGSTRVAMRQGSAVYYLFGDHLGSTSVSYRVSDGQTLTQRYYAWGGIRPGPNNALPTDYTFTGQKLDATGLMYYGARYYDSALGRFLSADTIVPSPGNPQTLNRYAYGYNNPLKYVDPTGHIGIPGVQGLAQLLQTIATNFGKASDAYNAGERRNGVLALHATGATGLLVSQAEAVNQLNQDTNVVFSQAPLEERLPHCVHLGVWATGTAATVVGAGQAVKAGVGVLTTPAMAEEETLTSLTPNAIGQAGEDAAGIVSPKIRIPSLTGTAKYRVPDELDPVAGVLREVKNVSKLSYTSQLRDYAAYAQQQGYTFELVTRQGTELSGPLQAAIERGEIIRGKLPW
jgi:RHS repeat-associated protein